MTARDWPITIEVGTTFALAFITYDPVSPTDSTPGAAHPWPDGTTARMQVRQKYSTPKLLEATTENGGILLSAGGVVGRLDLTIPETETKLITAKVGVYDLEIVYPGTPPVVKRMLKGDVTFDPNVTTEAP